MDPKRGYKFKTYASFNASLVRLDVRAEMLTGNKVFMFQCQSGSIRCGMPFVEYSNENEFQCQSGSIRWQGAQDALTQSVNEVSMPVWFD